MIILDIEASGLALESYPIEVAWQHRFNSAKHDSFLIRPAPQWLHWDDYAEKHIHHISRESLQEGIDVREAAIRLNSALSGEDVYTDAVSYDLRWMKVLFRAAGIEMEFKMLCVELLLEPAKVGSFKAKMSKSTVVHRALPDVRQIIQTLNYIQP